MVVLVGRKKRRNRVVIPAPNTDTTGLDPQYIDAAVYDESDAVVTHLAAVPEREHQRARHALIPKYENMRQQVAECRLVDEAKDIRDVAEALRAYARQLHDAELETMFAEIKLRAIRRIGEISADLEKAPGPGRGRKSFAAGGKPFTRKGATLKAANISTSAAHRAELIARLPKETFEEHLALARKCHRPVRVEELLRSVTRGQQLGRLRRTYDLQAWSDRGVQLFGIVANTGEEKLGLKLLREAQALSEEDKFKLVLALLADHFGSRNVLTLRNEYRQLLLRLLQGEGLIEALLHRLSELQPENHGHFLRSQMNQSTERERFRAVDWWDITREAVAAAAEDADTEPDEEVIPVGE